LPEPAEKKTEIELKNNALSGGWIDKIPSFKLMGVPVGDAAKGMVVAGLGDGLGVAAIKFLPASLTNNRFSIPVLKALTIMVLNWQPVKGFLGRDAVEKGSIILAYEGLMGLWNGRAQVAGILGKVTNKIGGTSTTAAATSTTTSTSSGTIEYVV